MFAKIRPFSLALLVAIVATSNAWSQETVLSELYGRGVHAYFAGNMSEAQQNLSTAIDQGLRDPRAYYFRGLAYHRQGFREAGLDDFRTGATLEAEETSISYPISKSLQRVQGSVRMKLEGERRMARLTVKQRATAAQRARFEDYDNAQGRVQRPDTPAADAGELPPPRTGDPTDPFGGATTDAAPRAAPMNIPPAAPAPAPADTGPFGAPVPVAPADTGTSPFGAPEPATPAPAAPADPNANPFGAPPPAEPADPAGNPFGAAEPAAPADAGNPFGAAAPATPEPAAPADAGNPFGAPATPEPADAGANPFGAAEPATPEPAEPADAGNPFGGVPPAEPADAGNPFGGVPPAAPADANPPAAAGNSGGGGLFGSLIRAVGKAIPDSGEEAGAPAGNGVAPADDAGGNPFRDDPVQPDDAQPGAVVPPANPFGGAAPAGNVPAPNPFDS